MDTALMIRNKLVYMYKKAETPILLFLKLLAGFIVFSSINKLFSGLGAGYCKQIDRGTVVFLASLITTIIPPVWLFVLAWLFVSLHLFFFSIELCLMVSALLLCLIFFYIRIFPKESYLIVLLLVCYFLKIPYFVPLFAGLFFGIGSVGALIIGALLWNLAPSLEAFAGIGSVLEGINVLELPQTFAETYKLFIETVTSNDRWIHTAIVFSITAIAVYIMSQLPVNYSKEISVGVGGLILIVGMIAGGLGLGAFGIIFSVLVSMVLALICKMFRIIVDYTGIERVTFEDDKYLYYVKAVPKIGIEAEMAEDEPAAREERPARKERPKVGEPRESKPKIDLAKAKDLLPKRPPKPEAIESPPRQVPNRPERPVPPRPKPSEQGSAHNKDDSSFKNARSANEETGGRLVNRDVLEERKKRIAREAHDEHERREELARQEMRSASKASGKSERDAKYEMPEVLDYQKKTPKKSGRKPTNYERTKTESISPNIGAKDIIDNAKQYERTAGAGKTARNSPPGYQRAQSDTLPPSSDGIDIIDNTKQYEDAKKANYYKKQARRSKPKS